MCDTNVMIEMYDTDMSIFLVVENIGDLHHFSKNYLSPY